MLEVYGFKVDEEAWRAREKLEYEVLGRVLGRVDLSKARVLDCGTGVGYAAKYLAERAKEVVTVDIDPSCLKTLSWLVGGELPENLVFVRADLRDLGFMKDSYFDVAVFHFTLHTVESTTPGGSLQVLKEAYRLLKMKGVLVAVENYPSFKPLDRAHEVFLKLCEVEKEILDVLSVEVRDVEYEPEELAELVRRAGFRVKEVIKVDKGSLDPTLMDWVSFLASRAEEIKDVEKRESILEKIGDLTREAERYGIRDSPSYALYAVKTKL